MILNKFCLTFQDVLSFTKFNFDRPLRPQPQYICTHLSIQLSLLFILKIALIFRLTVKTAVLHNGSKHMNAILLANIFMIPDIEQVRVFLSIF